LNTYSGAQIALSQDSYNAAGSPGSLRFYTGAAAGGNTPVERMRITSAGNVGIGTTSPTLIGTGITTLDIQGSNAGGVAFGPSGTKNYIYGASTMYVEAHTTAVFTTSGSEKMRITSGGNVGIGTAGPAYRLDVQAAAGVAVRVRNTFNTDDAYFLAQSTLGSALFGINATGQYLYTGDAIPTLFYNSGAERMRITSAGNVGIGTTAPTAKFGVKLATATSVSTIANSTGWDNTYAVFGNPETGTSQGYAIGVTNTLNGINILSINPASDWVDTNYYSRNHIFYGGETERMRITVGGNVGIGTTSPSYKLDVRGNLLAVGPNGGPGIIGIWEAESIASTGGSIVSDSSASGGSAWTTNGNYQLFGPYTNLPRGNYRLSVRVKVADASYTGNAVRINVYIPSVGSAQDRYIKGIDFSANDTWEMFSIPFNITGITANNVEFYVFGLNSQNISVDYLSVTVDNDSYTAQNWGNLYVNGNVGIGTAAQLARTTILSDSSAQTIGLIGRSADNIATIRWWNNAGNTIYTAIESNANYTIYNTVTNGYAAFFTNNSERLRITSGGNVGIGTTSPSYKLDVNGKIYSSTEVQGGTAYMADISGVSSFGSNTSTRSVRLGRDGTINDIFINGSDGYIGMGTNGPTQKLQVNGNVRVTGAYYDSNNEAGTSGQVLTSTGSGTDWKSLSEITGVDGTGTANYVAKWSDTDTIANSQIRDDGTTVGIGTAPAAAKLTVNGPVNVGGRYLYNNSQAALDTTGVNVAGLSASTNGDSAFFTFEAGAGDGQYQRIVYSCYNAGGTWNVVKVIDEGTNRFDVVASASSGSTITFTWKSRSGIIYYTPRLIITGVGSIDTTYL
jgi:hypothetical protein